MSEPTAAELKTLKEGGAMQMRDPGLFTVRLELVGGRLGAAQARAVAEAAERYGRSVVHLTTRQGIEIPHVPAGRIEAMRVDLRRAGVEFGRCGARVRTLVACPGTDCRQGLIDSQAVAQALAARAKTYPALPHKFKIGVTGCPNSCAKPQENDLGVMGIAPKTFHAERCTGCAACLKVCRVAGALVMAGGRPVCAPGICVECGKCSAACPTGAWETAGGAYAVFVGGKVGRQPQPGRRLPWVAASEAALLAVLDAAVAWYCTHGQPGERFGHTIERAGFDSLVTHLAAPLAQS